MYKDLKNKVYPQQIQKTQKCTPVHFLSHLFLKGAICSGGEVLRKTEPDIFLPCVGQVSIVDGSLWNIEIWRDELRALDEQNA